MKQRRNLFGILSMVLAFALLLTGCTTGEGSGTTTAATTVATTSFSPSSIEDDASLSIYIYTGSSNECYLSDMYDFYSGYKNLIDMTITEFDDAEEMESRLKLELAAGQGPDVIIADTSFKLDTMSLAKNGAFYDMTDVIAADHTFNNEDYYLPIMEAGQIDDRQYVIPLSFTMPTFVSTKTALGNMGINLETDTTMKVYEKILAHLKEFDTPQVSGYGGSVNAVLTLMQTCGLDPISYETGEVNLESEEALMCMEFGAEIYSHAYRWMDKYSNSTMFALETAKVPLVFVYYLTSPMQLQLYYSAHDALGAGDDVVFYFSPDENGNHHALVQEFAAVNANAKNPELAWKLIREIIDHNTSATPYTALSLNRSVTSNWLHLATTQTSRNVDGVKLVQLPQEYADQILDVCDTITDAAIQNNSQLTNIFKDGSKDYRKGNVTMDTMIADIQNKVKLYMNE